ncbi:MAG: hypothetical protein KKF48_03650 [Nanoarchaeota archaeon]|nr:hypothetical protein [Nanoarchaeota archaeon]MBU1028114.1 hypothetical protein [Nanoarchaeota archaeon]
MEYNLTKKEIRLDRKINELDRFVLDFCRLLDEYVLVSGYVSIIFGRSRATEDVDLLIPKMDIEEFSKRWEKIQNSGFECINTTEINEALAILNEGSNIRFSRKGKSIPNMEFKFIQNDIHKYSFGNKIKVIMKDETLYISSLEMQIAYKLMLGKEGNRKDLEDAKHIYELFKEKLNNEELLKLIRELNSEKEFELIK